MVNHGSRSATRRPWLEHGRRRGLHGPQQRVVLRLLRLEFAADAEPNNSEIHATRAALYRSKAEAELSLMGKAIYNAAARDSESV